MADATTTERKNSLRGRVSDAEWQTRVDLAAGCRMAQHFGWNNSIRNHLTARVPDEPDKFLMPPNGILWCEITASDFLKVDFNGKCYTDSPYPPGPAGLVFHGAILKAHPELNCSFHLHPTEGVVVAAMKDGLIYATQESLALYGLVGYHDFESQADDREEGTRIAAELGDKRCMIMYNHGLLSVGRTIAEGFYSMERLIEACRVQVQLMSTGATIRLIPKEVCELTFQKFKERIVTMKRPLGEPDWKAYVRLMEKKDPSFAL